MSWCVGAEAASLESVLSERERQSPRSFKFSASFSFLLFVVVVGFLNPGTWSPKSFGAVLVSNRAKIVLVEKRPGTPWCYVHSFAGTTLAHLLVWCDGQRFGNPCGKGRRFFRHVGEGDDMERWQCLKASHVSKVRSTDTQKKKTGKKGVNVHTSIQFSYGFGR